jgi:imidazolonepropionase-like amidohydrolase
VAQALYDATLERFRRPPAREQDLVDGFPALRSKFRQLLAAGVKLVVGSDAGSQGHFHADAIWWELRSWRENGASPRQILTAATARPARMLELRDRGDLAVGKRGDFLIYDGDLARGELELERVRAVGKGGVLFVDRGEWVGP